MHFPFITEKELDQGDVDHRESHTALQDDIREIANGIVVKLDISIFRAFYKEVITETSYRSTIID